MADTGGAGEKADRPHRSAAPFALRQAGHLLRRAYAIARRNAAESLSVLGDVSPVQAAALGALAEGALSQAELGRRIGMEPANTHAIVRRMRAAGLLDLQRDLANRRIVLAALTGMGNAVAAQIDARMDVANALTLAALDPDERTMLVAMLARIVATDETAISPVPALPDQRNSATPRR